MKKRLLSLLLAFVLVLGMMPVAAFAADDPATVTADGNAVTLKKQGDFTEKRDGWEQIPVYHLQVPADATVSITCNRGGTDITSPGGYASEPFNNPLVLTRDSMQRFFIDASEYNIPTDNDVAYIEIQDYYYYPMYALLIELVPAGTDTHVHEWQAATCTTAKTCSGCGETDGEALGHSWQDATCTAAKTCSACGETEGEALGHNYVDGQCTYCFGLEDSGDSTADVTVTVNGLSLAVTDLGDQSYPDSWGDPVTAPFFRVKVPEGSDFVIDGSAVGDVTQFHRRDGISVNGTHPFTMTAANLENYIMTADAFNKNFTFEHGLNTENRVAFIEARNTGDRVYCLLVELAPVQKTTYEVVLPSEPVGYTVTAVEGSVSPVEEGGSYSFTVTVAEGYDGTNMKVFAANDAELTAEDGVYTIADINANQTVTVTGVEKYSADTTLNAMVNGSWKAAESYPVKAVVGSDGILRVENQTKKVKYLWVGVENNATVNSVEILQGLASNRVAPSLKITTSDNVYDGTTYYGYCYSYYYTLPIVAKATVTAEDGVTTASHYIIISEGAAGKYVISVDGFTADSETYYKADTGISFTEADQKVTLTPITTSIGSGDDQELTWTWTTSDPTVAIVDENGVVTSVGGGTATITATYQQMKASCQVTSTAAEHNVHTYVEGKCSVCGTKEPTARKAYFTLIGQDGKFVIAKDNATELYKTQLTVNDADMDGTLTLNDAFLVAHETHSANGTADFVTMPSSYGPYIVKLWGVQTSNVSYYVNDVAANGLTDELKSNAELTAYFIQDTTSWSDLYTYFAADSYKAVEDKAQTIPVKAVANGKETAPKGATVTVYDSDGKAVEALATTVGEDGTFSITFPDVGSYTVEVSGKASYTGSAWDNSVGDYVDKEFTDAAVVLSRTTVQVYPYVAKTVYMTLSLKTGNFAVGKNGDEIYRLPLTVEDDQTDPDGQVTLLEVGAALHEQHHSDGLSAYKSTTGWVSKFWGDGSGSFGYYLNDVYMSGSGTKTGTNGRPFQDKLMATVVEDGDYFNFFLYQSPSWMDKYTYFNPAEVTTTVGEATNLTAYAANSRGNSAPTNAAIKVTDSNGTEQTELNTIVGDDGIISITFPNEGVYTVELRTNGSSYYVPSRCKVTVTSGILLGDVNDDGVVDVRDMTRLAKFFAGVEDAVINELNSDVTADGEVNVHDLTRLAKYFAGSAELG